MVTTAAENNGVPEGYVAIPVSQAQAASPLRICVLVRQTPDPAAGHFVLLRDLPDARVFLGCTVDACGRVREWLEIWVQNVDGLDASLPAYRETFSNFSLDERWRRQTEAFRKMSPTGFLCTGWEASHPLPVFLDLTQRAPVHPSAQGNAETWSLCLDDKVLQFASLPGYSNSLFRYLYLPSASGAAFVPVTSGAPENSATRPLASALANIDPHLGLNPQGGLMMATSFAPVPFEDYVDLLGGRSWAGVEHGKRRLQLGSPYNGLNDWTQAQQDNAHLFLGLQGRAGRFLETFHLKLQIILDALSQTRAFVQQEQIPFLNLSADSFRVSLKQVGSGLPLLWSAQCALVKPSAAFSLPVESSEFQYFIRPRGIQTSIYLPEGLSAHFQGSGSARIRKVNAPEQGRTVLEGTLVTQEPLGVSPNDLLWIRLPLPAGRLDLYGHVYAAESLAQGEVRFRTVPQRIADSALAALKAAEGVSFARSPFEVVPLLSSPCDLYSLGVLAVRAFLVDDKNTLAIALDEVLSLGRQLAAEHKAELPLGVRVRTILERDPRYAESLGPHRLTREGLDQQQALQLMPIDLWCDTLGFIVSLFPGLGPDSACKDFGDVPALALESVFNHPLEELEKLVVRSRSLIVIDWTYNQEIHSAIEQFIT